MLDNNYKPLIPGNLYKVSHPEALYVDFNIYKLIIVSESFARIPESIYYELTSSNILMYISHVPEIEYVTYEMFDRGYKNPMIPMYLNMNGKVLIPLNNSNRNAIVSIVNEVTPVTNNKGI